MRLPVYLPLWLVRLLPDWWRARRIARMMRRLDDVFIPEPAECVNRVDLTQIPVGPDAIITRTVRGPRKLG